LKSSFQDLGSIKKADLLASPFQVDVAAVVEKFQTEPTSAHRCQEIKSEFLNASAL
jgi:hypothetical protein